MPINVRSNFMLWMKRGLWVSSCLLLVACAGGSVRPGTDGAPRGEFDADAVPDAVPRAHHGAVKASPYTVLGKRYVPLSSADGYRASGTASWYGTKFHGHKTANGEVYDMYAMSAAHKTLPLPSYVRVTNLANDRSVVVRVNDRGPFHGDRLIDMSYAAARKLGFFGQGTARVKVEALDHESAQVTSDNNASTTSAVVETADQITLTEIASVPKMPKEARHPQMYLQVAALSNSQSAINLQQQLSRLTLFKVSVVSGNETVGALHRVRIGPLTTLQEVEDVKQRVDNAALGKPHLVYE